MIRRSIFRLGLFAIGLAFAASCGVGGGGGGTGGGPALGVASAALNGNFVVYGDALARGWKEESWDGEVDIAATSEAQGGTYSISATLDGYGGVQLDTNGFVDMSGCTSVRFYIHGGTTGGQQIEFFLKDGAGVEGTHVPVSISANQWTEVNIPFASLGSPARVTAVVWQQASSAPANMFYLDTISFLAPSVPLSLTVDVAAGRHAISPDIYGINDASEALANAVRLPVRRWGGDNTSRYNYQQNATNHGKNWYFENGSINADDFVDQDQSTGARTIMTTPLIGYVAKSSAHACGFDVDTYGAQEHTCPDHPECGNGVDLNGDPLYGDSPEDTSVVAPPSFIQGWINHLVSRYGTAEHNGVAFYELDNEPMLWNDTHRDVHPGATSYDELRDRTYSYAAAIKAVDPTAKTLGPVGSGWEDYFWSALDRVNGYEDHANHGHMDFEPWYLQQMDAYEQQNGVRILDYLDNHYYPQAPGVALSPPGDAETQERRLRSTRSLWDPSYVDESWIDQPVRLIPRMREWVSQYYPETKTAITEYNFGALSDINGAVAQADVLGIFGREGLDMATLWWYDSDNQTSFEPTDPGAFAFRMYRNYDGAGKGFGDVGVQAVSTDQESLAIYASLRSTDGALTLMVVNKSVSTLSSPVNLSHFPSSGSAAVYRYSSDDLQQIVRLGDLFVTNTGFLATFPGSSITLFVLPMDPAVDCTTDGQCALDGDPLDCMCYGVPAEDLHGVTPLLCGPEPCPCPDPCRDLVPVCVNNECRAIRR